MGRQQARFSPTNRAFGAPAAGRQPLVLSWARLELCLWGTAGGHCGTAAQWGTSGGARRKKKALGSSHVVRGAVAALSDKPALLLPPARPCQGAPRAPAPPPRHRLGLLRVAPGGTGQEQAGGRLRILPTRPQSSGAHRISQNLYCQQITKVRGPGERTALAPQGPAWWAAQAAGLGVRAGGRGETRAAPLSAARSTLTTAYK